MNITIIPQLSDNFCFHVEHNQTSFIVDCAEVYKVAEYMKHYGKDFSYVLTTHKHHDHSGGNLDIAKAGKQVVGGSFDKIPGCTMPVENEQVFHLGGVKITCLHTPCHTRGHILYLCEVEGVSGDH